LRDSVQSELIVKKESFKNDRKISISIQEDDEESPSLYGSPMKEAQKGWKIGTVNEKSNESSRA